MSERLRSRSPVKPGDVVGGKYRVERGLGAGGMGVVVAATHVELGQPVALKFILPEHVSGKGAVERFMREARVAVRLKSEHVARVFDVGRDAEDRPYMVLELLEGLDLARFNKQKGPLPVADAVEYVLQACEALVEAHAMGLVHRDLKPQNLFVTRRLNGTPLVKVLDFGISKAIGPAAEGQMALTDSSAIIGSPLYMAPEQMRSSRSVDVRSDVWALGVILYELLGGQLPFDGETVTAVCIRVVNEEPERLLDLRPALDPALVDVVMRCLEKDPEDRWQNVAQLAAALEPYSRSAKQGGPVRPWRSFEDTQDSRGGGARARPASPDETGPSTAITMPSIPPLSDPGAAEAGGEAMPGEVRASSSRPRPRAPSERPNPLGSTDASWGESTSQRPPGARRARSFTTGLVAGAAVSITFAAAAVALFARAPSSPAAAGAAPPELPPTVTEPAPVLAAPPAPPASGPEAAPSPPAVDTSPAAPPRATAPRRSSPRPASAPPPPSATASTAPPPRAPEDKPEPAPPNGAPILR